MKTFLEFFEVNRGLERTFAKNYPNLPPYVSREILRNRIAPIWNPVSVGTNGNGNGATNSDSETIGISTDANTIQNFRDIGHNSRVSKLINATWSNKPMSIQVGPDDFDVYDQIKFLIFKFGLNPKKEIRNDARRFSVQQQKAREIGQNNEPIVVLYNGKNYEMQEGWHRLMSYFLHAANPDQIQLLRYGKIKIEDLKYWPKVQIRAYVGTQNRTQNNSTPATGTGTGTGPGVPSSNNGAIS